MGKFELGGDRPPITIRDWAEMIADRFESVGVTIKEEGKHDVLRHSLEEFYYQTVKDVKESILTDTSNPYLRNVMMWAVREREKKLKTTTKKRGKRD